MGGILCLDQRKKILLKALLDSGEYLTSGELAAIAGVAPRTVRTELKLINGELELIGASLESSAGRGYRLAGQGLNELRSEIEAAGSRPSIPDERMYHIAGKLLQSSACYSSLLDGLGVSESTLDKDLDRAAGWFRLRGLTLSRRRDLILLKGDEDAFDDAAVAYYFELADYLRLPIRNLCIRDFPNPEPAFTFIEEQAKALPFTLTDDEYYSAVLYLLVSGIPVQDADIIEVFRKAGIPAASGEGWSAIRGETVRLLGPVLGRFTREPSDDELADGICRTIFSPGAQQRLLSGSRRDLQQIEKLHPEALRFALALRKELDGRGRTDISGFALDQAGLCYAAFIERSLSGKRKRAVLVSGFGTGLTQLTEARLKSLFPNLELAGVLPEYRIGEAGALNPDFLITTSGTDARIDSVRISGFMDNDDFDRILPLMRKNDCGKRIFAGLCSKERFFTDLDFSGPEQVIRHLCRLSAAEEAPELEEKVLERESLGSTSAGNLTAIPHALLDGPGPAFISIGVLRKPLKWGTENVRLVFLIRLDRNIGMAPLFDYIYSLINDKKLVKRILSERDYASVSAVWEDKDAENN